VETLAASMAFEDAAHLLWQDLFDDLLMCPLSVRSLVPRVSPSRRG
jgi:hypothetical protein